MVLAFFGKGKGKTTTAVGTMIRTIALGKKVAFIQLYKNQKKIRSGEVSFLQKVSSSKVVVKQFGKADGWVNFKRPDKKDKQLTCEAINFAYDLILANKTKLIVLDEVLLGHYYGLCEENLLENLIKKANENEIDVILTGRKMKKDLIRACDLVSEIKKVKHPYDEGKKAKRGIDY